MRTQEVVIQIMPSSLTDFVFKECSLHLSGAYAHLTGRNVKAFMRFDYNEAVEHLYIHE